MKMLYPKVAMDVYKMSTKFQDQINRSLSMKQLFEGLLNIQDRRTVCEA
jgi:hypothetical protein